MTTRVRIDRPADLGPALREVRRAEELTQGALADLAGVGRQWLNSFEMGDKTSAPLDMVMRVLTALHAEVTLVAAPRPAPASDGDGGDDISLDAHLRAYDQKYDR